MLPVVKQPEKKSVMRRLADNLNVRQWGRATRIGFIVDATGSRDRTWEDAQVTQGQMFRSVATLGTLSLRLVHFGGGALTDHGWERNPRTVAANMAKVRCETAMTQIIPALTLFLDEAPKSRADTIILIGDCFEEDAVQAAKLGHALKVAGIKVFAFLEGEDWTADAVFRGLADTTGGRFAKLGDELPLGALCEGVALLAAGGEKALAKIENKTVKRLLLPAPEK